MRVQLQRVISASVTVDGQTVGAIGAGYVLFVGVMAGDTAEQAVWLAEKIVKLRMYDGLEGKINDRSLLETGGGALVVSQFTLAGRTEKGSRPDYTAAAKPDTARPLYDTFVEALRAQGVARVETGRFGAHMTVSLVNDGPVTLLLEH